MKDKVALKKDFIKFNNEVIEYTMNVHKQFTKHNAMLFLIYGLGLGVIDIENKTMSCVLCYLIAGISFGIHLLAKYYFPKNQKYVLRICNVYLFVFLFLLRLLYFYHPSRVANILLICSLVTTSLTSIIPKLYGNILICISLLHVLSHSFLLPYSDIVELVGFWLNDLIIVVFAIRINRLFANMKYEEFKQAKHLRNESYKDPLTNLYNRRYVERYVDLRMEDDDNCVVLLLDLDNFKSVNDKLGHEVGDELLCNVSSILKQSFRKSDCVARIGGDEFLVIMPDIVEQKHVIQKVSAILSNFPIFMEDADKKETVCVSVSIGIAFSKDGDIYDYEGLYRKADAYMYKAKNKGKGIAVMESLDGKEDKVIVGKAE